jgi:spermidine synthase
MKYEILDQSLTPDGEPLELAIERGYFVLRVNSRVLMSSASYGSEQAMARIAAEKLGEHRHAPRVLVGGLGMGHTLRAVLDEFPATAAVSVAELLPDLVRYNRGVLGPLARHPLLDRRVTLFVGDVADSIAEGGWDAILLDVDNGPDAFVDGGNANLYSDDGCRRLAGALNPGGVAVVWSAYASRPYEASLRRAGLACTTRRVSARAPARKGGKHVLFIAEKPSPARF